MTNSITNEKLLKCSYEKIWTTTDLKEEQKYYELILNLMNVTKNKKLLDVACGGGYLLSKAEKKGLECYGIDISDNAIKKTKSVVKESRLILATAETIPFHKNFFDYITCLGSLEHFLSPEIGLEEMRRVLKDDGLICIVLPNIWCILDIIRGLLAGEGLTHGQESERFYSLKDAMRLIETGRFEIKKIDKYNQPPEAVKCTKRLPKYNSLFFLLYKLFRNKLPVSGSYVFIFTCTKRYLSAPSSIDIGKKEHERYLGQGWHDCENWPPKIRWTGKKCSVYLRTGNIHSRLFIKAFTSYPNINVDILIDRKFIKKFSFDSTEWKILEVELSILYTDIIEVIIEVDKTWVPDKIIKNGDIRELGIAIEKIWIG